MAKKYLLYIHAGEFEKEKKKSDLVNHLLDEYYGKSEAVYIIKPQPQVITKIDAEIFEKAGPIDPILPKLQSAIEQKVTDNGTCKIHGTPLDRRGRCMQKDCKYA